MEREADLLVCECSSNEHHIIIRQFDYDDIGEDTLYISIHLSKRRWWRRVIPGIKYIFGYGCRYGQWEEVIIGKQRLINVLTKDK